LEIKNAFITPTNHQYFVILRQQSTLRLGIEKDSFEGVFPISFRINYVEAIIDLASHIDDTFPVLFKNEIEASSGISQTQGNSGIYLLPLDGISEKFSQMKTATIFLFFFSVLIKFAHHLLAHCFH
jgi:hypothetical protein